MAHRDGIIADALVRGRNVLDEAAAKQLVAECGIAVPRSVIARDPGDAAEKARRLAAPFVVKVVSPDILHKSDVGGVRLGLIDAKAVRTAVSEMAALPGIEGRHIDGWLVEEMGPKGEEFVVGAFRDPQFGPMIMVGLGGVTTELFRDVVYRPAPVSAAEASIMLAELKAAPLLNGFRGAAKADIAALSQLIAQVSLLAAQHAGEISEIELNPVLVHPQGQGVTVVDALVVRKTR